MPRKPLTIDSVEITSREQLHRLPKKAQTDLCIAFAKPTVDQVADFLGLPGAPEPQLKRHVVPLIRQRPRGPWEKRP